MPPQKEGRECHTLSIQTATQSRWRDEYNSATLKNEVGKQQHPRREEEWEATHSKEEGKSSTTHRRLRSSSPYLGRCCFRSLLFWVEVLFPPPLRWCCCPPSFGCGGAFLPWVVLLPLSVGGAVFFEKKRTNKNIYN